MNREKLDRHIVLVWHAVIGKQGISSGHAEILQFSRKLSPEEESQFQGRCRTMLGPEPITTERFDAELESICTRFEHEFTVDISILEPNSAAAVVVSAREPAPKRDNAAVRTALLAMDGQGPGDYPVDKRTKSRRRKPHG